MRNVLVRVLTLVFALSVVASPQLSAMAMNQDISATPIPAVEPVDPGSVPENPDTGNPATPGEDSDSSGTGSEEKPEPAVSTPDASKENGTKNSEGLVQPLAASDLQIAVAYNSSTGNLDLTVTTMTANIAPGTSVVVSFNNRYLEPDQVDDFALTGQFPGTVSTDWWQATVEFEGSDIAAGMVATASFPVNLYFPDCTSVTPGSEYQNSMVLEFEYSNGQPPSSQTVTGEQCEVAPPASELVVVEWVSYTPSSDFLDIEVYVPSIPLQGSSVTVTYPSASLSLSEEPVEMEMFNWDTDEIEVGAVAQADNAAGVITITFIHDGSSDNFDSYSYVNIPGALVNATCDPSQGSYPVDMNPLTYTASTGGSWEDDIAGILCNAAPASKTGIFSTDGDGNEVITWTMDSGDILSGGDLWDGAGYNYSFDCSSLVVEAAYDDVWVDSSEESNCNDWYFQIGFGAPEVARIRVTINAYPIEESDGSPYINCMHVEQFSAELDRQMAAAAPDGLSTEACYELFREGDGDYINKTVSATEVRTGDTLTYTIDVSTTAFGWEKISISDPLPEGFQVTSVTCTVVPARLTGDPCYVLNGNQLTSGAMAEIIRGEGVYYDSEPVTISLVIEGVVTAPGGSVLVNEACSERMLPEDRRGVELLSMGDPTIIGGGVICDEVTTNVLVDPVPSPTMTPEPTGVATPEPATPGATPTMPATPAASATSTGTPGAEPTATAGVDPVTGLPSTGDGASGTGATILIVTALAAAMLMTMALGVRIRSSEK